VSYEAEYSKSRERSDDDIKDITENNKRDINFKDNGELMSEWDTHMQDFFPEDITTFIIKPRTKQVRFQVSD
jgi:hypothetical protein